MLANLPRMPNPIHIIHDPPTLVTHLFLSLTNLSSAFSKLTLFPLSVSANAFLTLASSNPIPTNRSIATSTGSRTCGPAGTSDDGVGSKIGRETFSAALELRECGGVGSGMIVVGTLSVRAGRCEEGLEPSGVLLVAAGAVSSLLSTSG